MQQSQYKNNFELKFLARVQTGQHLGLLVGALLLKFIITFTAVNLVSSLIPATTTISTVINYIAVFAAQVVASVLNVGTSFIFLKTACNMPSTIEDLFCGFRQNTVKILKIGAVIAVIESICMIPLEIALTQYAEILNSIPLLNSGNVNDLSRLLAGTPADSSELIEAYSILYSATMKFFLIMFFDFTNWSATTILKKSFEVMNGQKVRLLLLYISFIPVFLLSLFTCGIALIWVYPYRSMALANLYLDIMSVRNKTVA